VRDPIRSGAVLSVRDVSKGAAVVVLVDSEDWTTGVTLGLPRLKLDCVTTDAVVVGLVVGVGFELERMNLGAPPAGTIPGIPTIPVI